MSPSSGIDLVAGQSGAEVRIVGGRVHKTADDAAVLGRLREQHNWLLRNRSRAVVDTRESLPNGYVMERLTPVPWHVVDSHAMMREIESLLERHVWPRPPRAVPDWEAHREYVHVRATEWRPQLVGTLNDTLDYVIKQHDVGELRECETHGDPTFSNVMQREGSLVLIDPIPASGRIPSLRAVDLGKVVQSLIGYERIRFGWPTGCYLRASDYVTNDPEGFAIRYFAIVHVLRLLPYSPPEFVDDLQELIDVLCHF